MTTSVNRPAPIKLRGVPLNLDVYEGAETITSRHFQKLKMPEFEKIYLPDSVKPFTEAEPVGTKELLIDDNRSAVSREPCLAIDGTDFYFSVKGIGSTTSPFSRQLFKKEEICSLLKKSDGVRDRIMNAKEKETQFPRYLTGELWSRGCPYGSQGLEFASIAMKATEMSDASTTSIHGFRIAPLVKIVKLPKALQNEITQVYWYRRFKQEMVQEARLVPSNVRIYFHSDWTIGDDTGELFDFFHIENNDEAMDFLRNFVKSGIAILTLFVRSMRGDGRGYTGLDFYDVWLDKDAVLAPDGTIFWADLEGLQEITVGGKDRADLEFNFEENMEHQIYRSLYEFMYAYEQVERERTKRFGYASDRKTQFEYLLRDALRDDEVVDLHRGADSLELVIGNVLGEERLTKRFVILDW